MLARMQLESVYELKDELLRRNRVPATVGASLPAGRPESLAVVGPSIALGLAPSERPDDYRLAVRVQRRELMNSERLSNIVARARGEADVEYVGRGFKQNAPAPLRGRCRPVLIGSSVAHHGITAGTVGCFVEARGGVRLLSNNHVLADEDRAQPGDAIVQPGPRDGGRVPQDVLGSLDFAIPLDHARGNRFDAALATVSDDAAVDAATVSEIGRLAGVADPFEEMLVAKVGRTTATTYGHVIGLDLDDVWMEYETGWLRFDGVVQIRGDGGRFTSAGDSGSLVVTRERECSAVALHFGGYENETSVACPLAPLLQELQATLVF
jgi:hypothetical protein